MPRSSYFYQTCPTCGRSLQVRVEYLGREVICRHCRGRLVASDADEVDTSACDSQILERANHLLSTAEVQVRNPG
ncbi:MAG: hypothetical protein R3C28_16385 [Pirellulaceae bacterium]